nr:hypothetical protein [Tanacetum cinerariifolium]
MDQNIDLSGSDQIQTLQYPEIHPPSNEISDEVFQAKGDLMKSIQTFLKEFNYMPFEEKLPILFQAWFKFFAIHYAQPEDSNELFHKFLEDLQIIKKELIDCNHPTFFDDNSSKEIATSKVCEEQKQKMENTMLELVKICQEKELLCMHDNIDDLIESALNSKLLSINSQRLDKKEQEVKNVVEHPVEHGTRTIESWQNFRVIHKNSISLNNTSQIYPVHAVVPILSTKEPKYSSSMGYEHPNTTPETESDEIIKSGVDELVPILSENEVTSEDKRECDMPICENSPICDDHSEIFFDSKNDDDISSDDDDFKDIDINRLIANIESLNDNPTLDRVLNSSVSFPISKESDNSFSDNFSPEFETFCDHTEETRSGNTTHANGSLPGYDSFYFDIEHDQEKLINVVKIDIFDDSSNDPLLEEAELFLASDNSIPPGIENFPNDSEGDIRFLEELLSDDSILFPNNESFDSKDNPSFPRPPPEPPDAEYDFKLDA